MPFSHREWEDVLSVQNETGKCPRGGMSRGNWRLPAAGQSQDGATAAQRGGAKWVVTSLDDVIFVVVAVVVGWSCSCPPVCVYS